MSRNIIKAAFTALCIILSAAAALANSRSHDANSIVDKSFMVEIKGPEADDLINIMVLPGESVLTRGRASVVIPELDEGLPLRHFKYLICDSALGCFGVLENFSYMGKTYDTVGVMIAIDKDKEAGIYVYYSIDYDDETLLNGAFALDALKFTDLDGRSFENKDASTNYNLLKRWLKHNVEKYKD